VWSNSCLVIKEVPIPKPGDKEVLIEVRQCGISGSDVYMAQTDADGYILYSGLMGFTPITPLVRRMRASTVGDRLVFERSRSSRLNPSWRARRAAPTTISFSKNDIAETARAWHEHNREIAGKGRVSRAAETGHHDSDQRRWGVAEQACDTLDTTPRFCAHQWRTAQCTRYGGLGKTGTTSDSEQGNSHEKCNGFICLGLTPVQF